MIVEPFVSLAIRIRPTGSQLYALEMLLQLPTHGVPVQPLAHARLNFSFPLVELLAISNDLQAYGRRLSATLFDTPKAAEALAFARSHADASGLPLHISLDLSACDQEIHTLRWETLQDSDPYQVGLALNERTLFSRALASDALIPINPRPTPARSAVIAVAAPDNLAAYGFDPIPVATELTSSREALTTLKTASLARTTSAPCTLARLLSTLREGPDLLCLTCHGRVIGDQVYLWLEDEHGQAAPVAATDLAARLSALPPPAWPALIVLAACESGASVAGSVPVTTVGPLLAGKGIVAVVGVNGPLSFATNRLFLPALLSHALHHGVIDHAVAVARNVVIQRPDWWAPILWLRLPHGRLWAPAAATPTGSKPSITRTGKPGNMIEARGFAALKAWLTEHAPDELEEVAALEGRFEQNRRQVRRYGSTETLRHEWSQIIDSLNQISYMHCGVSFVDLCRRHIP